MNLRRTFARILAPVVLASVAVGVGALGATSAQAMAYPMAVPAPVPINNGSTLSAWVNLSRNCVTTFGCANFMTIDFAVGGVWQTVAGGWAVMQGWNNLLAPTPVGCSAYRTTVVSYNDTASPSGPGLNLGLVGQAGNGVLIYRHMATWSSPAVGFCY